MFLRQAPVLDEAWERIIKTCITPWAMETRISEYCGKSLAELVVTPREVIGFDSADFEMPQPFLLAIPEKIVKGVKNDGLHLIFHPQKGQMEEEWTLYTRGKMMQLWALHYDDYDYDGETVIPRFSFLEKGYPHGNPYVVENAYSGKEAVLQAFKTNQQGFAAYAPLLESGHLVTERSRLGELVERTVLGMLLPNQLRFKRFFLVP